MRILILFVFLLLATACSLFEDSEGGTSGSTMVMPASQEGGSDGAGSDDGLCAICLNADPWVLICNEDDLVVRTDESQACLRGVDVNSCKTVASCCAAGRRQIAEDGVSCGDCEARFTGDDCGECVDGYTGGDCTQCANPRFTGDDCSECAMPFEGDECDECPERFTGPSCDQCAMNFAGANCDECSERFSGEDCTECNERFTGQDCSECADERFTGEACTTCVDPSMTGVNCDEPNTCPRPRVAETDFAVHPLDLVVLDGSMSTDPDGPEGLVYEWVVVERPVGSTSQPLESVSDVLRPGDGGEPDQTNTSNAVFFVDLAGIYVIELRVTDPSGSTAPSESCPGEPVRVTINALPSEDIHLQLVWDTPEDMDQTDSDGTDLDLHLRHPNATDWEGDLNCYFANPNPDWGESGSAMDDPSLDIDDTDGAGPENINLDNPELTSSFGMDRDGDGAPDGKPYLVGVHYYRSDSYGGFDDVFGDGGSGAGDYGLSNATVRIYLDGTIAFDQTMTLRETDDFWTVGAIEWGRTAPERRVIELGEVTRRAP